MIIMAYEGFIKDNELAEALAGVSLLGVYSLKQFDAVRSLPRIERRIENFWQNFEASLEHTLESIANKYLAVAQDVVIDSVAKDAKARIGYDRLQTASSYHVEAKVDSSSDIIAYDVIFTCIFGNDRRDKATRHDLNRLSELSIDQNSIPLDSVDGLTIDRYGRPVVRLIGDIEASTQLMGTDKATHGIQLVYGALIPKNDLARVYGQHNTN